LGAAIVCTLCGDESIAQSVSQTVGTDGHARVIDRSGMLAFSAFGEMFEEDVLELARFAA